MHANDKACTCQTGAVGHVRQQGDGGVAGQEQVVQVGDAIEAVERLGLDAACRHEALDHVEDAGRVLAPRMPCWWQLILDKGKWTAPNGMKVACH